MNGTPSKINKQLLTTIGLTLSLLYIVVDKAFLQIGVSTSRVESQVSKLIDTSVDSQQRIARLEECIRTLVVLPQAVYQQTEAIAGLKAGQERIEKRLDEHMKK